ncbi:hypothetical protein J1N35_028919, partial [Gossypium stocksii]
MSDKMLSRPSASSTSLSMPDIPLKSHSTKKISSLYEIEYLKEEYKSLIQNTSRQVKEYSQASRFDSNHISASSSEQFITFEIPLEFPKEWIATLNSGLVMVTLFPNFMMALANPNLLEALKVQIQNVGAPQ